MQMHLKPHPSSSWQLGNMMVAYAQSIYPLIKITSILKKKKKKKNVPGAQDTDAS